VFGDASKDAYATVVFLRTDNEFGVSVKLIQSKSRVSPLKSMSIPRLEKIACTMSALLVLSIKEALEFENTPVHFKSNSRTALAWIKRNDNWRTFVGNRVREILKYSTADQWRHVPGTHNPADLQSRGCT